MYRKIVSLCCFIAIGLVATRADADILDFEDFAPSGGLVNVNPAEPYMEDGYTMTPFNGDSAVFDSAAADMFGNDTDFFGFEGIANLITLTNDSGTPFNLTSIVTGPIFVQQTISIFMVGNVSGGGILNATLTSDTALTTNLNWSNLTSVTFTGTGDSGLDDIVVNTIPEPSSTAILGVCLIGAWMRRRR